MVKVDCCDWKSFWF